jgi:hypothetical protein
MPLLLLEDGAGMRARFWTAAGGQRGQAWSRGCASLRPRLCALMLVSFLLMKIVITRCRKRCAT